MAGNESSSWKIDYYLALNLLAMDQKQEALQILKDISQNADEATFYLSRALLLESHDQGNNSLADLEKSLEMDKTQWRTWFQLAKYYTENDENQKAMALLKDAAKAFPGNYVIEMELIQSLNENGNYKTAMAQLEKIKVLPHEGAGRGRSLYENVYLNAALQDLKAGKWKAASNKVEKSRMWPENLGVGKPFDPDEILQDYLQGMISKAKNNQQQFVQYMEAVIAQAANLNSSSPEQALAILALKNTGREDTANELMKKIKREGEPSAVEQIERLTRLSGPVAGQNNDSGWVQKIIQATQSIK
jgi:tetratricopeptide (TPR) repeat protein